jgi:hypothetical protein
MTENEKLQFIENVFELEIEFYINGLRQYERQDEFWLDKYLTKSNYIGIFKAHLDDVYQTALKFNKK